MPLYEYKCHSCGKTFEALQKFSDEPLKMHAECGGAVERLLSAPAFHLKGTGWYATDYGKGGILPKGEAKGADGKSDSGADSKTPDAKTADSKTSETKSSDTKTASETKTAESKPAPVSTADTK